MSDNDNRDRLYALERVGPALVARVYADGFERLSRRERIFSYHLTRAAIAGRDIYFDQKSKHGLEVKRILEALYPRLGAVRERPRAAIERYTKLFWLNNGFYDHLSAMKFTPECGAEDFFEALDAASRAGARIPRPAEGDETERRERLARVMFDPEFEKSCTNKTPGADMIAQSHNNFYEGVTFDEVDDWAKGGGEHHPLNSKVVKENGRIEEKVWRAGGEGIPPGMYAKELTEIIRHLARAMPYACSPRQQVVIRKLMRFFRTGEQADFDEYCIAWVRDRSRVDFILGFIEVYLDARGAKGAFEGIVFYTDPAEAARMDKLAALAGYFEQKAPWDPRYKKEKVAPPAVDTIHVLCETGDAGPITPIGINLPNAQDIRERYGSKSVSLTNVMRSYNKSTGRLLLREFASGDEEIALHEEWGEQGSELHVALHEVIGHGSGKVSESLEGKDPQSFFPGYYSTLEETRADLMALYNGFDEALVREGIVADPKASEAACRAYVRNAFVQLRRVPPGQEQLEEDHMKNRQLIVNYILDRSRAVKRYEREGKTFFRVEDLEEMRRAAGELLAEVMRIKAEGDLPAAKALIDRYGLRVDPVMRDEVHRRAAPLDEPLYTGFVYPELRIVREGEEKNMDVLLEYPESLAEQMVTWRSEK